MEDVTFRLMNVDDVEDVYRIEEASFAIPWSRDAFVNEMVNNRFARYVLIEMNEQVIGYCGLWIIVDEGHITNIALLPQFRGKKLGEALMKEVLAFATENGAKTLTLEVRPSNDSALGLYQKLGFQKGGIRKNYYADNNEDALVMWVNLDESVKKSNYISS